MTSLLVQLTVQLLRRSAQFPGRWRALRWLAKQPRELLLLPPRLLRLGPDAQLLVEAHNNRDMYVQPEGSDKDELILRVLDAVLRPGDSMLDIGANIGRMSVLASRRVGASGRLIAYEPSPLVVASLYKNLFFNQCGNVAVRNCALADSDGTLTFHVPLDTNSGLGSLRALGPGQSLEIGVPTRRLDSEPDLPDALRLIKIDTEGADLRVLRGGLALIERCRPVIAMEFSPKWIVQLGDSPDWIFTFAQTLGYSLYSITEQGLTPLLQVPPHQIDLLCTPTPLRSQDWAALREL